MNVISQIYERMFMLGTIPINGISHGKDIALRMEVLSHTHLTQTIDGHDPDIQGENGLAILVTGHHGNRVTFRRDGMSFQPLWFCMTDGCGRNRGGRNGKRGRGGWSQLAGGVQRIVAVSVVKSSV